MAAYAALASLAQTTLLATNQHNSLFSITAKENITSIHEYVIFLLSFLEDFPEKAKRREAKMRDVAHEIEDIIEQFLWQHSFYDRIKLSSVKVEEQLRKVHEEIGLIAGEVMEERPDYLPPSSSSSSSRLAPTSNDAVVGLDEDIMEIKDRLCGLSSKLQVIPIVGMGGIGKTTLVRTVYHDSLIVGYFHIRVWLTISQEYSAHKILLGLVDAMNLIEEEQISKHMIDDSTMAERVYKNLKGRRYLIVMDDVWSTKVLDDVRKMFPDDGYGSRIMITTRLVDVASYPNSNSPHHVMRFMNDDQSWDLLKRKVFERGDCPPEFEDVGSEIARRCAGLPLAIVLVAGILSPINKSRGYWEEIATNVNPVVDREIEEILSLSYTYLPHHLRPCFLYFGGFQEDANIRTSRLVRLWIAEGFLKHQNGCSKSWEEEGEEYLEDLIKRNLVIVTSRKSNGKIKSCSTHDMVRDLCIRKAHDERFLRVMGVCDLPRGLMNERCISFCHLDKFWVQTIRTILCFQTLNFPNLIGTNKLLRVLDALCVNQKTIPPEVFHLYQLRYLALMGPGSIPSSIYNLVNLQTLIIHSSFGKIQRRYFNGVYPPLPSQIWSLSQLRHLLLYTPHLLPRPRKRSVKNLQNLHTLQNLQTLQNLLTLQNLQTLSFIADLVWKSTVLQMVPNVKRLGLTYTFNREYHLNHLKDLHQLERLEVIGYQTFSWREQNPIFPCTLRKLTLVGGGFPWSDMAIVGSLPNLEVLKLLNDACIGEAWETADEDFPRVKYLLIDESHLCQWITQSKPFKALKRLVLRSCWYLREIPKAIGKISTLELIEVDYGTKSLMDSAKKIKEDEESYGNYTLQVRLDHEEIQSCYKRMDLFSELQDQLKEEREEISCLPTAASPPSTPACNNVLIGLDKDVMALKEQLCGQSSKLRVVPIVGVGGIGKTTLARTIYNDPLIMNHFTTRAWVTVSQDHSQQRLSVIILGLAVSMELFKEQKPDHKIEESAIAYTVFKRLKSRRYLIVIDDIWSIRFWNSVRCIFPNEDNGSRIMLTSSVSEVAAYPESDFHLHLMRSLTESQSWILLEQNVFTNNCPPELEHIGKEIAGSCFGLPIVVLLVAGIMSRLKKTRASWKKIAQILNLAIDDQGLGGILSLSYTQLPYHLRSCFLHMGVFPDDIYAPSLIEIWVTDGLLKNQSGSSRRSLEDEGLEYLEDLVKRNLVTVTGRERDGRIGVCKLHYMVRDLCIRKANEERNDNDLPSLDAMK